MQTLLLSLALALPAPCQGEQEQQPPLVEPPTTLQLELVPHRPQRLRVRTGPSGKVSVYVLSDTLDPCFDVYAKDGKQIDAKDDEGGGTTPFALLDGGGAEREYTLEISAHGDLPGTATVHFVLHPETDATLEIEKRCAAALQEAERLAKEGRDEAALAILRQLGESVLEIEDAELSLRMMSAAQRTAFALRDRGDVVMGTRCLERALRCCRVALPETHPHVAQTENNVCHFLFTDAPEAAIARATGIVEAADRRYPEAHARPLQARELLANLLVKQGRYGEAIALRRAITAARPRLRPADRQQLAQDYDLLLRAVMLSEDWALYRACAERAVADLEPLLAADDPKLLGILAKHAGALTRTGQRQEALESYGRVIAAMRGRLGENDLQVLAARANRADLLKELGSIEAAIAESEDVLRRLCDDLGLADEHAMVLWVRGSLGDCYACQGRSRQALKLIDQVVRGYRLQPATYPETHPSLLAARSRRALRLMMTGCLTEARAEIESALAVVETVPPEYLANVRWNLRHSAAIISSAIGDLVRARALYEALLEAGPQTGPTNNIYVLIWLNYSSVLLQLGEFDAARQQIEAVERFAEQHRVLSPSHPVRVSLCMGKAAVLLAAARHDEALAALDGLDDISGAHQAEVLSIRSAILGAKGDSSAATPIISRALALIDSGGGWSWGTKERLQRRLFQHQYFLGDKERARQQARGCATAVTARTLQIERSESERAVGRYASDRAEDISALLTVAQVSLTDLELQQAVFQAAETLRSASLVPPLLRQLADVDPKTASLREEVERLGFQISDVTAAVERATADAQKTLADQLDALVRERDRQRAVISTQFAAHESLARLVAPASVARTAAALRPGEAAVGYYRYDRWNTEASDSRAVAVALAAGEPRYLAGIVGADASLRWVDLGAAVEIEDLVASWRRSLGVSAARGLTPAAGAEASGSQAALAARLRDLVLTPVLAAAGAVERLVVAPDSALHLVPLDALPAAEGGCLGDAVEIVLVESLRSLDLVDRDDRRGAPSLVVLGGVDYGAQPEDRRALPTAAPRAAVLTPLPGTAQEVAAIAEVFRSSFAGGTTTSLTGGDADRARLLRHAPGARYLHLATHGWFARELAEHLQRNGAGKATLGLGQRVVGYAPLTLCGLALAGANLSAGENGSLSGRLTAEELSGLDLAACELVVLSACETAVGLESRGEGLASLRRALSMAGARRTLTSLWMVPDAATQELMVVFYEGLWAQGLEPRAALWRAKRQLRQARDRSGKLRFAPRDWAGWVLYGPLRER